MRSRRATVFTHPPADVSGGAAVAPTAPDASVEQWYPAAFARVQRQLRLGNSYEVNLTYREEIDSATDPVTGYLRLRRLNPAPYAGFVRHGEVSLLSSSPERFATVDRHRWVETRPIKGTSPRGATPAEDERNRRLLQEDPRFRAENLMIVDLLRNDLSMVCEPGTVRVPALMEVESYPGVHQLVSTVRGRLREGVSTMQALRALFPAGSMTGAPKLRTMEIIADVETTPRGVYSGALGWLAGDGRADLGVVIRTLVGTPAGSGWRYQAGTGGGVTVHSDAASELAETRWKIARLRAAVA
jgi:para-aminobenzoate synthetase